MFQQIAQKDNPKNTRAGAGAKPGFNKMESFKKKEVIVSNYQIEYSGCLTQQIELWIMN